MSTAARTCLVSTAIVLSGCSSQPLLNPPTGGSGGTSIASQATGSGTTGGTQRSSTTTLGTSSTGGSATSIGCGAPNPGFAGSWDTAFAQLTLVQDGGSVVGTYHDWGYTDEDPMFAGTIAGTVCGIQLAGSIQANAAPVPASLSLLHEPSGLEGTFAYPDQEADPIVGVPTGMSLPPGSGWSAVKLNVLVSGSPGDVVTLTQTGDEVDGQLLKLGNGTGTTTPVQDLHGIVSDYRLNGEYIPLPGQGEPGRISFAMTPDGTQFTGNSIHNSAVSSWCGYTTGNQPPASCLGGGGGYDGTWFTNLGVLTLSQPMLGFEAASSTVTGVWFLWGSDTEYSVSGTVTDGLSWTDHSPVGGAIALLHTDPLALTLSGFTAAGGLWCGVDYTDGLPMPYGTLPAGCGLSGSWTFPKGPSTGPIILTQIRGVVGGSTAGLTVNGDLIPNPIGGPAPPLVVSGSWTGTGNGGSFTWDPDAYDQTFSGETGAGAVWCGTDLPDAGPGFCP